MTRCRHDWTDVTHDDGTHTYTCLDCDETSAACNACGRPTSGATLACDNCRHHHIAILTGIAHALAQWRHEPRSTIPAIRYDRDRIRGTRNHAEHDFTHPRDILGVLWGWLKMWTEAIGEPLPNEGAVTEHLAARLTWAIQNPDTSAWHDYANEAPALRHHARRLSHLLPQRLGPCMHCGGRLVRDWTDRDWNPRPDGLSDTVRCTGCAMTWNDRAGALRATRGALHLAPELHPDAQVTLDDARRIFTDVPAATWRSWEHREQMPEPAGRDVLGRPLYRLGDLHNLTNHRRDTARRGRPAKRAG